jgi:hypothetical protein
VLFCESAFRAFSDHQTHANLKLVVRELAVQINATHELPVDVSPYHCIVLQATGLQALVQPEREVLRRFVEAGGRVFRPAQRHYYLCSEQRMPPKSLKFAMRRVECSLNEE